MQCYFGHSPNLLLSMSYLKTEMKHSLSCALHAEIMLQIYIVPLLFIVEDCFTLFL